jgi:GTP-binding protein YchF
VIVLYDELDLAPGKMKVKKGGGAAGHNGIRSIDAAIGPDFWRVRIGIGHPGHKELVHGYVLHAFAKADRDWLDPLLDAIADEIRAHGRGQERTVHDKGRGPADAATAGGHESYERGKLMGFQCGIVGLPNVGKSTLFNALTATQAAQAANYPFCTIEPNVGRVAVPDPRLDTLAKIGKSATIIPTQLEFVDIAGLVRGASKGEGLGNQFLAISARSTRSSMCCAVSRAPTSPMSKARSTPLRDAETVETELMLADMDGLERRVTTAGKKAKGGDADAKAPAADPGKDPGGAAGRQAGAVGAADRRREADLQACWQLLTGKPVLYICNVSEDDAATGNAMTEQGRRAPKAEGAGSVVISAAIESEIAQLSRGRAGRVPRDAGPGPAGLDKVIRAGYSLLDLITYFTVGPKEARAWTVRRNAKAPGSGRRDPRRFRTRLHPRRDHRL